MLRIVYLTDEALAITKRLMLHYPEGKLFRNSKGVAWTTDAVNCAFTRLQTKAGRLRMRAEELEVDEAEVAKLAATLRRTQTASHQVADRRGVLPPVFRRQLRS